MLAHSEYITKYVRFLYFVQMLNNKNTVHIHVWWVSAQAHIQNMQTACDFHTNTLTYAKYDNKFANIADWLPYFKYVNEL